MKRREFLESVIAAGCIGALSTAHAESIMSAAPASKTKKPTGKFDENMVVFLSDVHTNIDHYQEQYERKTVAEILKMNPLPKNIIVTGDIAYLNGEVAEYQRFKEIIAPLEKAGITITLGMGNHDYRDNFAKVFPEKAAASLMKDRYVYVVETPKADFVVIDSLQILENGKHIVTGIIDEAQKEWLKKTLAERKRPTFVCAHHPMGDIKINNILLDAPTCCGYIYGHDHRWRLDWFKRNYRETRLIRTLCLPSTGHWGDIGYTIVRLEDDKAVAYLKQSEFFFPTPKDDPKDNPPQWAMITEEHKNAICQFSYKI